MLASFLLCILQEWVFLVVCSCLHVANKNEIYIKVYKMIICLKKTSKIFGG